MTEYKAVRKHFIASRASEIVKGYAGHNAPRTNWWKAAKGQARREFDEFVEAERTRARGEALSDAADDIIPGPLDDETARVQKWLKKRARRLYSE